MWRVLFFTMLTLLVLTACVPQGFDSQTEVTALSVPSTSVPVESARLLQAKATYLGTLPVQTPAFAGAEVTPMPACGTSPEILYAPLVRVQGQVLEVRVCYRGQAENYAAFHVYLDMKEDRASGFAINGLRAKFLVENDVLFRYRGSGHDWKWEQVAPVLSFEAEGGEAIWKIPLAALGTANGRAVLEVVDKGWNAIAQTVPIAFSGE